MLFSLRKMPRFLGFLVVFALCAAGKVSAQWGMHPVQTPPWGFGGHRGGSGGTRFEHCYLDFTLAPGYYEGLTNEIVYNNDGSVLSRLDWQERTFSVAVGTRFRIGYFSAGFDFFSSLPKTYFGARMEDYDWLDPSNSDDVTNYSNHFVTLEKHMDAGGDLGVIFSPWILNIAAAFGVQWRSRKWDGHNGYLQYPPGSEPKPLHGSVISYEQTIWIPYLHLGVAARFFSLLELTVAGRFYPSMTIESLDHHKLTDTQFLDKPTGALGGKITLRLDVRPEAWRNFGVFAAFNWEKFTTKGGTTGIKGPNDSDYKSDDTSYPGTASEDWNIFVGVSYRLDFNTL